MKTIHRVLGRASLIFAFILVASQGLFSENPASSIIDNFTITVADHSENSSTWNLKYSEAENAIKITMAEKNGEKMYTVESKFFDVVYIMNKNGFGARMIKGGTARVPAQILEKIINGDALKNQKVISATEVNTATALNLIASYLPDLINVNYKHLLQ